MASFVINEWLWEDSSGVNGLPAQRRAFSVITEFAKSDHRLVVIAGSAFDKKAWRLCKSTDATAAAIARAFVLGVRSNSDRVLILRAEEAVGIPDELAAATKADDHYLLQAQLSVAEAILISTDEPLREAVRNAGFNCLSREEFLTAYF